MHRASTFGGQKSTFGGNNGATTIYIQPQVLEFTDNMSVDMLRMIDFRHIDNVSDTSGSPAADYSLLGVDPDDPLLPNNPDVLRVNNKPSYITFNGRVAHPVFPTIHLVH